MSNVVAEPVSWVMSKLALLLTPTDCVLQTHTDMLKFCVPEIACAAAVAWPLTPSKSKLGPAKIPGFQETPPARMKLEL